jgi:hypothetical protein
MTAKITTYVRSNMLCNMSVGISCMVCWWAGGTPACSSNACTAVMQGCQMCQQLAHCLHALRHPLTPAVVCGGASVCCLHRMRTYSSCLSLYLGCPGRVFVGLSGERLSKWMPALDPKMAKHAEACVLVVLRLFVCGCRRAAEQVDANAQPQNVQACRPSRGPRCLCG